MTGGFVGFLELASSLSTFQELTPLEEASLQNQKAEGCL